VNQQQREVIDYLQAAVAEVNPILRGWVNYFKVGNSSQAFNKVKYHVERKVRRFAAKQRKRTGFGWKRWSSDIVYGSWGLFRDYHLAYASAKARTDPTDSYARIACFVMSNCARMRSVRLAPAASGSRSSCGK
jgi:hypothetical protein